MRVGIISDIHGNIEALRAVFDQLEKRGCDELVCLGDIVGYGPSPGECIDFLREKNVISVKGNHDHYVVSGNEHPDSFGITESACKAVKWTREVLSREQIDWLDSLPFTLKRGDATFIHAAVDTAEGEYWPYIFDVHSAMFHFYFQETTFAFFGHIHVPLLFAHQCNDSAPPTIWVEKLKDRDFREFYDYKFLINPGSVGQPRNCDPRGSAIIFDMTTKEMEIVAAEYDVKLTCGKIIAAGLPGDLAHRLGKGY